MNHLIGDATQVNHPNMTNVQSSIPTPAQAHEQFSDIISGAIDNLNHLQNESNEKTKALAAREVNDLHDVMITSQKASITLEATVQIQRRVIDAYNKVMQMQV